MQPDTMMTPTASRHKKTQQTHQEEILLPPVILDVEEGFQRFEEEDNPMEEDEPGLKYISQYDTPPKVLFEESTYPYLQNFHDLTGELTGLAASLKKQGLLEDILKDEAIAKNLEELAGILPAAPIDRQLLPLLSGISDLCLKVNSLTNTLENHSNPNTNTIYGSIHAPNAQHTTGPPLAHNSPSNPSGPSQSKITKKTPTQLTTTHPITRTNPRLAHHPTRIVVQFPPKWYSRKRQMGPKHYSNQTKQRTVLNVRLQTSEDCRSKLQPAR